MPNTKETSIFGDALQNLNKQDWQQQKGQGRRTPTIPKKDMEQVAKAAGFTSREPSLEAPEDAQATEQRRYRTGRSEQMNLKVRHIDKAAFLKISDQFTWVQGYTFQRALEALQRELEAQEKAESRKPATH